MEIVETNIPDVKLIKPRVFRDARGYFMESYRATLFKEAGITTDFVQDNQSLSGKNILRGLHFQAPPYAQAKLVRVVTGAVIDVVVDIRKGSPHYGQHVVVRLDTENMHQLFIPEGFAHGFLTLEDHTIFQYKCSNYYHKESEGGLAWNDPEIGIAWDVENPVLSDKDRNNVLLQDFNSPFQYSGQ